MIRSDSLVCIRYNMLLLLSNEHQSQMYPFLKKVLGEARLRELDWMFQELEIVPQMQVVSI